MKNLGNIALLLAAGAGYVASLPTTGVPANQLRAVVDNVAHEIVPRESEKNDKKTAEAGVAAAAGEFFFFFLFPLSFFCSALHTGLVWGGILLLWGTWDKTDVNAKAYLRAKWLGISTHCIVWGVAYG